MSSLEKVGFKPMFIIVGSIIVLVCVFGAYAAHGGHLLVLWQPSELVIIGGAALGSLLISSPMVVLKEINHQILLAIKGKTQQKSEYMEILLCLFEIIKTAKGNPLAIEAHVEKPENSEIFKKYPGLLANKHLMHFMTDTLKVQVSSPMSSFDLEELMDKDIETVHQAEHKAPAAITKLGDALPGLGIVAAVLGVVNTMGKLQEGKEVIGHSVAAALVGTFLGILMSYGFVQPLATKIEGQIAEEGQLFQVIKVALIAFAKDCSPKVCVEFARRSVPPHIRPSFEEVDKATSNIGKGGAATSSKAA